MESEQANRMADTVDAHLQRAYCPDEFRRQGHLLVDLLADYWQESFAGRSAGPMPWQPPNESLAFWEQQLMNPRELTEFARDVLHRSVRISDPRFLGHQICAPTPAAILAGLLVDCLNNGSGVYEMGMAGTAMEKLIVRQVATRFGWPETAGGFLTSGGTLANLTALLAARSVRGGGDIWHEGQREPLAVMVSEQAHYCIDRAVRIMGWGDAGIVRVPVDSQFRMRVDLLPQLFEQTLANQRRPIAVVATAGTTSTGSFDDLAAVGDFCQRHGLWFHVDGAHGGALAFSDLYRHKLAGIERADSVVLDFHKMLMTPVTTSALIFRQQADSYRAFSVHAEYLFNASATLDENDEFNLARRTFECTKVMMSAKVFANAVVHGWELFGKNVDRLIQLAQQFAQIVNEHPAFELAVWPECNIVCFRHAGGTDAECSARNAEIRRRLVEAGKYYIVQTRLGGTTWLRCTLASPFTGERVTHELLDELERLASTVSAGTAAGQK